MGVDGVLRVYRWVVLTAAVLVPVGVGALLAEFRDLFVTTNAALVLVLVVVAAAATGLRSVGLTAALVSAISFDFFLTEPFHELHINDRSDIETTVLLLILGAAVTEIALWGRRAQARSSSEQGYLDGLLTTANVVATSKISTPDLMDQTARMIVQVLGVDSCRFEAGTRPGFPTLDENGTMTHHGRSVDVARRGLPTDTRIAVLAQSGGVVYGHFSLAASTRVVRPTVSQLRIAVALANQAAGALAADAADAADAVSVAASAPARRRAR